METFRPWPATVIRSYYEHPPDSGYLCVDVGDKVSVLCAQEPGAMSLLTAAGTQTSVFTFVCSRSLRRIRELFVGVSSNGCSVASTMKH